MQFYLLTEPSYETSSWCRDIKTGLLLESRRKRATVLPFPNKDGDEVIKGTPVVIIGSLIPWLKKAVELCQGLNLHPIILSNQPSNSFNGEYSSVSIDIPSSMLTAYNYFKKLNSRKTALFGVNPMSLADNSREKNFRRFFPDGLVFYNDGSIEGCFADFSKKTACIDSVICANDFAALYLIKKLEEEGNHNNLSIISYSSTLLPNFSKYSIPTLSLNFNDFGHTAIKIVGLLKNGAVSGIHVTLRCTLKLNNRALSEAMADMPAAPVYTAELTATQNEFYLDPELAGMARVEKLLNACDYTDRRILAEIIDKVPYDEIAEKCFLSPNGIKYRINKMTQLCEVANKKELLALINMFIDRNQLLE